MRITRIVAGADGISRFLDAEVPLADRGRFGFMSEPQATPGLVFREVPAAYDSGWHAVPGRLYLVVLDGALHIETGDGQQRELGPGSVILAEDESGAGHRTRAVGGRPVRSLLLRLA